MYELITQFIRQRVSVPDEAVERALSLLQPVKYAKGDFVLRQGAYCRFIGFINKGLIMNTLVSDQGKEIVCFEILFNQLILEGFQNMLRYEEEKRSRTAEERYVYILENHPELLDRAPLKYIAGYLDIEPPSLSRLRKRFSRNSEINKG